MRIFRLLLVAAGGMAVVAGAAVAVAFNSSFQTWYVQRRIAARPEFGVRAGTVSAGWQRVELRNWRVVRDGGVLMLPAVEVELPVASAAWGEKVAIRRLVAHGWTLELSAAQKSTGTVPAASGGRVAAGRESSGGPAAMPPADAIARVRQAFGGVFAGWSFPVDLSLDGADLAGTVVLPEGRGRVAVRISGGGFRAAEEGTLQVVAEAGLNEARVSTVAVRATLAGRMPTPRELAGLRLGFAATAQGTQFPSGVELAGEASVARSQGRETYAVRLSTRTHEILNLGAEYPAGSGKVTGTWKLNMRDDDVGPFALGVPLPRFATAGEGLFEFEFATAGLQASGSLAATAGGLGVLRPELAVLGEVKIHGDFDLAERDGVYAVRRLVAGLATSEPVATVTALQPFEFSPASGALRPTDATRELVGVVLHGLPVAWTRPLLGEIAVSGGNLQGEFTGLARGGGIMLRTTRNVTMAGASLARAAQRWMEDVGLSFATSLDYNPQGWQVEVSQLSVRKAGEVLLTLDARAGQLNGKDEPVKTTGKLEAHLAGVVAQPFAAGLTGLTAGEAAVEFAGSLGQTKELYAKVELRKLQGVSLGQVGALPSVAADVRVDLEADGKMAFRVPVTLEAGTRQSDFSIFGTGTPDRSGPGRFDATVTGAQIVVADVRRLGAALAPTPAGQPGAAAPLAAPARASAPWAGMAGSVALKLGLVEWSETWRATQVSGRLELEAGRIKLEDVQAGFGEKGRASLSGALTYDGGGPQPYQLEATVSLKEFDPALFFPAAPGASRPMLDGRFELTGQVTSRAADLEELVTGAGGEFRFASKGGVFRGLPAMVSPTVASTGRVAGFIAAAGSALGGLTGRREAAAVAGRAQAVAEFSAAISSIAFDQLSFGFTRDVARHGVVRDFALIAPELRLTGGGSLLHRPGKSLGEDSLAMEFKLTARGRQAELLQYLGVLDSVADQLGYAPCSLPIRLGGTLAQPDASDLSTRLAALAIEKSGVTEKAGELFNRIIGGGK